MATAAEIELADWREVREDGTLGPVVEDLVDDDHEQAAGKQTGRPHEEPARPDHQQTTPNHDERSHDQEGSAEDQITAAVCPSCGRATLLRDGSLCLAEGCDWFAGLDDEDQAAVVEDQDQPEMLAAALDRAAEGWTVIPTCWDPCDWPAHNRNGPCAMSGKRPLVRWKNRQGGNDLDEIRAWWAKWPRANIAGLTGARSGRIVVDLDGPEAEETLARLETDLDPLPATLQASTRRGRHLILEDPGHVKNRAGNRWHPWGKDDEPATSLDIRGDGGIVILPPSIRAGVRYTFTNNQPAARPGEAWAGLLQSGHVNGTTSASSTSTPADDDPFTAPDNRRSFTRDQAAAYVEQHALAPLRDAPNGARNDQLNASAMVLGHFVPAFWAEAAAVELLTEIAEQAGLDDDEISDTIASGLGAGMADPYELAEDPADDEHQDDEPAGSWTPVDLTAVLAGDYTPPRASIGRRSDGVRLLYPGREHAIASEPEAGKTWLLCQVCRDELADDGRVIYVDFEDDEAGIVGRLLALGADPATLGDCGRFRYVRPAEPATAEAYGRLLDFGNDTGPTLVALDGVTEGYGLHGWSIDDNDDSPKWRQGFIKPAIRAGAATLASDHVVKNPENRRGYAIGAQHKKAGLTGALFGLVNVTPLGRGLLGRSRLIIFKDRPGGLRQHGVRQDDGYVHLADLILDARDAGKLVNDDGTTDEAIALEIRPPAEAADGADDNAAAELLEPVERIREILTERGPMNAKDLRDAVRGRAKDTDAAVQYLIGAGELHEGNQVKGSAKLRHLPSQCREGFKCFNAGA